MSPCSVTAVDLGEHAWACRARDVDRPEPADPGALIGVLPWKAMSVKKASPKVSTGRLSPVSSRSDGCSSSAGLSCVSRLQAAAGKAAKARTQARARGRAKSELSLRPLSSPVRRSSDADGGLATESTDLPGWSGAPLRLSGLRELLQGPAAARPAGNRVRARAGRHLRGRVDDRRLPREEPRRTDARPRARQRGGDRRVERDPPLPGRRDAVRARTRSSSGPGSGSGSSSSRTSSSRTSAPRASGA